MYNESKLLKYCGTKMNFCWKLLYFLKTPCENTYNKHNITRK